MGTPATAPPAPAPHLGDGLEWLCEQRQKGSVACTVKQLHCQQCGNGSISRDGNGEPWRIAEVFVDDIQVKCGYCHAVLLRETQVGKSKSKGKDKGKSKFKGKSKTQPGSKHGSQIELLEDGIL